VAQLLQQRVTHDADPDDLAGTWHTHHDYALLRLAAHRRPMLARRPAIGGGTLPTCCDHRFDPLLDA
jgi:hypothetical protein